MSNDEQKLIKVGDCLFNKMGLCTLHHNFPCYGPEPYRGGEIGPPTHCGFGRKTEECPNRGFAPWTNYCFDCMKKISTQMLEEKKAKNEPCTQCKKNPQYGWCEWCEQCLNTNPWRK